MQLIETLTSITSDAQQQIDLPIGWNQGRSFFGGFSAAVAYQHARNGVDENQPIRALTVSFVAPLKPGSAVLKRRILRQGKNVTQVAVEIEQEHAVGLSALLTFGQARPSQVQVTDVPKSDIPPREQNAGFRMPDSNLTPEFTRHYEYCLNVGAMPFSGQPEREFGGWVRYRNEAAPISVGLLLGLVDAWPPAVLPHLDKPAPASSLTWTIEFPKPMDTRLQGTDWWQYVAYIDYAADGYGHTHAHIWDQHGELVAISRQTVTVFG